MIVEPGSARSAAAARRCSGVAGFPGIAMTLPRYPATASAGGGWPRSAVAARVGPRGPAPGRGATAPTRQPSRTRRHVAAWLPLGRAASASSGATRLSMPDPGPRPYYLDGGCRDQRPAALPAALPDEVRLCLRLPACALPPMRHDLVPSAVVSAEAGGAGAALPVGLAPACPAHLTHLTHPVEAGIAGCSQVVGVYISTVRPPSQLQHSGSGGSGSSGDTAASTCSPCSFTLVPYPGVWTQGNGERGGDLRSEIKRLYNRYSAASAAPPSERRGDIRRDRERIRWARIREETGLSQRAYQALRRAEREAGNA